jgi:hypothetical protein
MKQTKINKHELKKKKTEKERKKRKKRKRRKMFKTQSRLRDTRLQAGVGPGELHFVQHL